MELLWDRGTKVCSNGPGHMTKMAAMPIYGKNLKKISSPEPKGLWDRGTKVCSNGPGHMTKMAAMPIYGKNLKKFLLRYVRSSRFFIASGHVTWVIH